MAAGPSDGAVGGDGPDPASPGSVRDALSAAARGSAIGKATQEERLSGGALLAAMGGARGIVESVLPAVMFLVAFTVTGELVPSVVAPVVIAVAFIVIRLVRSEPVTSAIAGALGIGISAGLALLSGRTADNFVPGLLINAAVLLVMLVSLAVRRAFIGVLLSFATGDGYWRDEPVKRRTAVIATWLWALLMIIRLGVEVPLYLLSLGGDGASFTQALGATKLLLGVPMYALLLWITWLLVRPAWFARADPDSESDPS